MDKEGEKVMPDREKIIKDLEFCVNGHYKVELSLATKILALLKEQEPIKPKSKVRHGENGQIQHWCGNCMAMLHGKPKYCSNCGRQVKWE